MWPRFTPKADLFKLISESGWKNGMPSATGSRSQWPEQLRRRCHRNTKHAEPSRRTQRLVALPPVIAAERIGDERHTFSIGEPLQFDRPVLRAVVDGFVKTALLQEGVLAAACRSVDLGADVERDVDRGKSDAAADIVNQHGLLAPQRAHDYEQLPCSEVVYRDCRSLFMGQRGRFRKELFLRHDHYVRIAAETRQRKDVPADPGLVNAGTYGIRGAGNFVADNAGNPGRVGIKAPAREDVGKVNAAGFYANPDLARRRARVRGFAQLQLLRTTMTDDEHLFHFEMRFWLCEHFGLVILSARTIPFLIT